MLKRELNILLSAFLYFSRIQFPFKVEYRKENQAYILTWFPLVGIVVGGIGALVYWSATSFLPHLIAILLALAAMILSTGALHEDGWADVCDAFGGGYSKAQRLEIMKDSRLGTYATIGLIFLFALKISLLYKLSHSSIPIVIIATHALSRFPLLLVSKFWHNARATAESKSRHAVSALSWQRIFVAFIIGIFPLLFLFLKVLIVVPIVIFATLITAKYFEKRIGGYTGDCLGMMQQLNEILLLVCFSTLEFNRIEIG